MLRKVDVAVAIEHALWEANQCRDNGTYCACLAMLRKAIDLLSSQWGDKLNMIFDKTKGERNDTYWRLIKIAEANRIYAESIYSIIDSLRIKANEVMHESYICEWGENIGNQSGIFGAMALQKINKEYDSACERVTQLIQTTMLNDISHSEET